MKRLTTLSFAMAVTIFSLAQQPLKVTKKENIVNEVKSYGRAIDMNGKAEDVNAFLGKYLKEIGKTRTTADYYWVASPLLSETAYDGNVLYAKTNGDDKKTQVWIGIDTAGWRGRSMDKVFAAIEKFTYQFGVRYYRDLVQKDIDQSQQALEATEKQKLKLVSQNKDLNSKVASNDKERARLEASLQNNKLEKAVLLQKLVNNKRSQDSVALVGVQVKKVMDAQVAKQKKIN